MKVTIIQLDIVWCQPEKNIRKAEFLINQQSGSDLYVLPEMWSTGFATEPFDIAEDEANCQALKWMRQTACDRHCAISGSLAVKTTDGKYKNRHYFVDGRSEYGNSFVSHYDKHHLFRYGKEDLYFEAGEENTIVTFMDRRFLLLTCYDMRFPMWSRYTDNRQYDAIICVANWPVSRQNAFQILTRARAIENQAFLIACNRVGNDQYCHYYGQSAIISPIGKTLAQCMPDRESAVMFEIDFDVLDHQRSKFRVLDDRDER